MTIESPPEADDVPAAPDGLSPEAEVLWADVISDLAEDDMELDARESALLREVCRHLTLANRVHRERGCSRGLNPPVSSRDLAM